MRACELVSRPCPNRTGGVFRAHGLAPYPAAVSGPPASTRRDRIELVDAPARQCERFRNVKLLTSPEVCWKSSSVEEMALLVDADIYYRAFVRAARHARRS